MAAANIGNPAGAVVVFDGGNPRIVSGRARALISGGVFVFGSTATAVVSSGLNSFVSADVQFAPNASGEQFNGIILETTGSNSYAAVATRGVFILQCVGSVFGGYPVACDGNNSVVNVGSSVIPDGAEHSGMSGKKIGRALVAGASNGYTLIDLNP